MKNSTPSHKRQKIETEIREDERPISKPSITKKWIKYLLFIILFPVLILCMILVFLPSIVSSDPFKGYLEQKSYHFLRRSVQFENIEWSWGEGVLVEGLRVKDDPAFSLKPIIYIARIRLVFSLKKLLDRLFFFDLELKGLDVLLIRDEKGIINLERMLANLTREEEDKPSEIKNQTLAGGALALPFDIQGSIKMEGISIEAQDQGSDQGVMIKEGKVLLEIPSLKQKPISIKISSKGEVNGNPIPPLDLSAMIDRLTDQSGRFNFSDSHFKADCRFPGVILNIEGGLLSMGLKGNLDMDFKPVTELLRPFFGSSMPDISGRLFMQIESEPAPGNSITFKARGRGEGINISNGFFQEARLGPVNIKVEQEGIIFPFDRILEIRKGKVRVQENSYFAWHGTIKAIKGSRLEANVSLNPVRLDLGELTSLARGFIPVNASGRIDMEVRGEVKTAETISFKSKVIGTGVLVSGMPGVDEQLGPLDFKMSHDVELNLKNEEIKVREGKIRFQDNSSIEWHGNLKGFDPQRSQADFTLGPVSLDMKELYSLAEKIIPYGVIHQLIKKEGRVQGDLRIDKMRIKGPVMSGSGRLYFDELIFHLPDAKAAFGDGPVLADELSLHVYEGEAEIESFFPSGFDFSFGLKISNILIQGNEKIKIDRLSIPSSRLVGRDISKVQGELFGLKGSFLINGPGLLEGINGPRDSFIPRLRYSLKAEGGLKDDSSFDFRLNPFTLSTPSFSIKRPATGPFEGSADLGLDIQGTDMKLSPGALFGITGRIDFKESITAKKMSGLPEIYASGLRQFSDGVFILGPESLKIPRGHVSISSPLVRIKIPSIGDFETKAGIETIVNGLLFKKSDSLTLDIDRVDTEFEAGDYLKAKLESSANGLGSGVGDWQGKVSLNFGNLISLFPNNLLPGNLLPDNLLLGTGLGGKWEMDWVVNGKLPAFEEIRQSSMEELPSLLKSLLKRIDGKLHTHGHVNFDSGFNSSSNPGNNGSDGKGIPLFIKGQVDADTDIQLEKGKSLRLGGRLKIAGLDMAFGDLIQIKNLESRLRMEKQYFISFGTEAPVKEESVSLPLSAEVLQHRDDKVLQTISPETDISRKLIDDLRGKIYPGLSFDYANIKVGPFPIEIKNHDMAFRLKGGLPTIDYFQTDLLGGSVIGRISISEEEGLFQLKTECSFSGLNARGLLTPGIKNIPDEEAEISGQLSLGIPVLSDIRGLLDRFHLTLDLTHIGSKTLEQFLYAVDPYDNNETIVKQRQLLRIGSPKRISLKIRHGNLSLTGQLDIKGTVIDLPEIDRLSIVNLPIHGLLEQGLSKLKPGISALKILSANRIHFGPGEQIEFVSSNPVEKEPY